MGDLVYKIIKHDGGWAYTVNGTFSEAFPTRAAAREAAKRAAAEQQVTGATAHIEYEDDQGRWHTEVDPGSDRPHTRVEG